MVLVLIYIALYAVMDASKVLQYQTFKGSSRVTGMTSA